jgi:Cu2+-exporting ATPase
MNLPETCIHCDLPIPAADRVIDQVDGEALHFCCQGCRGAYLIITGAGLDAFYKKRAWGSPGIPEGAFDTLYDEKFLQHFIVMQDDRAEISLLLEGIRCSACVWLIERVLEQLAGVLEIRVNYSTHAALIRFDPEKISPAVIFHRINQLGYLPRPYSRDAAHEASERERKSLLIRFGTAAFLSMQLMGYSIALYAGFFQGMSPTARTLLQYLAAAVATPVVFYSGMPFLQGAARAVRNRAPNMDLLIGLGVLTAYTYSIYAMLTGREVYFETAAMIITLILLGRLLEHSARRRASAAIDRLLHLAPETATKLAGNDYIEVDSSELQVNDVILVRPGDRLPVDGLIVAGTTEIDESVITGEPFPVTHKQGSQVSSGSLNMSTAIKVRVTQKAAESFVARVARLVQEAQNRRAPLQAAADRVAAYFVPFVIFVAAATLAFWLHNSESLETAMLNSVAVLVVACPCALGLATPTAVLVATGAAASHGILFRGGDVLEACGRITMAGFDKTGTLTMGRPQVIGVHPLKCSKQKLLQLAASAESGSSHPLALGIINKARRLGLSVQYDEAETVPGRGVMLQTGEGLLLTGSRLFLHEQGVALPAADSGHNTEIHIALAGEYQGYILLADPVRPEASAVIRALQDMNIKTALLTGDHHRAGLQVANQLGIKELHASMSPENKADWIRKQAVAAELVLMAGDGINDSPALSAAAVGCAMAGGTDIALESSDLVLTKPDLNNLSAALIIARRALRIIRQNLFWAFSYNLVAIPLAAAGKLAPVYAAAAMAVSSITVLANSLRLARIKEQKFA